MTDRSSPITLKGKTYHLRYNRGDIKAIENALGVGYLFFIRPGTFDSITAMEAFLWRGLYEETKDSNLVHVFEQTDAGKDAAGDLLWDHLGEGGKPADLHTAIFDAFVSSGVYGKKKGTEPEKNLTVPV